jgi:hypothetical protein
MVKQIIIVLAKTTMGFILSFIENVHATSAGIRVSKI